MGILSFEDMLAWKCAKELSINIYGEFRESKDFSFRDQIQRASISIGNNIAEGFERQTNKEFKQFLYIAKGSCGEVRSMLYVALDLKYMSKDEFEKDYLICMEISRPLSGFIKKL